MKKPLLFLFTLLGLSSSYAQTFTVGGINYNVTNANTKEVEVRQTFNVAGDIIIPASVVNASVTYSVTSIGYYAFPSCTSLRSISLPASVTSIGESAFTDCSALTAINADPLNPNLSSDNGILFNKDKTVLVAYPAGKSGTSYSVPISVTGVGDCAFSGCKRLTSLSIPTSVTSIGNNAFASCSGLTSLIIPTSVTSIGSSAFSGCTGLTSLSIPTSVTFIKSFAFSGCSGLTSISIPNSIFYIDKYAFEGCTSLTSVSIPTSVAFIGQSAFEGCTSLTSVSIPTSVISIGYGVFANCRALTAIDVDSANPNYSSDNGVLFNKDKTVLVAYPAGKTEISYSIPNSVTSILNSAFYGCTSLTSITIPTSVTSIGYKAFCDCKGLTSLNIPNSVAYIREFAFERCTGLTSLDIPSSITSIGNFAFYYCTGLKTVNCAIATPPTINSNVFIGITLPKVSLTVPSESFTAYKTALVWKDFGTINGVSTTGIEDLKENTFTVSVYPNPVVDMLTLKMENLKQVSFYSIDGLLVLQSTKNEINLSALVSGVYLAKIENTKGQVVIRRVVKK
ncbi:MAG TPA: leucine-rich repeat protein [Tenuifilaceae bacterium]|nr:leucine-rich repeat protein [Tenuifilaceae bacterium]